MSGVRRKVPRSPWDPPVLTPSEVMAMKALRAGNANEGQQKTAMHVIMHVISGVDRLSFIGGNDDGRRATDFSEGRRWVGLMIDAACSYTMPAPKPAESGPHAVPKGAPPGE